MLLLEDVVFVCCCCISFICCCICFILSCATLDILSIGNTNLVMNLNIIMMMNDHIINLKNIRVKLLNRVLRSVKENIIQNSQCFFLVSKITINLHRKLIRMKGDTKVVPLFFTNGRYINTNQNLFGAFAPRH